MPNKNCESCLMPLAKDPDSKEGDRYCSFCFKNGKLTYEGSAFQEFQRLSYQGMISNGMNPIKARIFAWSMRFAPRWKKTKK